MAIPFSRSLIFEVKSTGSELAFGRFWQTSDVFGRLRTSSGIIGNDRVVFKNPSTTRIKISRLYVRKSWQVCNTSIISVILSLEYIKFRWQRSKISKSIEPCALILPWKLMHAYERGPSHPGGRGHDMTLLFI